MEFQYLVTVVLLYSMFRTSLNREEVSRKGNWWQAEETA